MGKSRNTRLPLCAAGGALERSGHVRTENCCLVLCASLPFMGKTVTELCKLWTVGEHAAGHKDTATGLCGFKIVCVTCGYGSVWAFAFCLSVSDLGV
jgi:hypothetical protein